jgi:hypothetical protein
MTDHDDHRADELAWLAANAPSPGPSPEVTERHRSELRAAIAAERAGVRTTSRRGRRPGGTGPAERGDHRRSRPRHTVVVAALAVTAVCAAGALVLALGRGDDSPDRVRTPAASDTTAAASAKACGTSLPIALAVPTGYEGPRAGSSSDADTAADPTQLAVTWTTPGGNIELRWPADAANRADVIETPGSTDPGFLANTPTTDQTTKSGKVLRTIVFQFPQLPVGCQTVQVDVYGDTSKAVAAITTEITKHPLVSNEPLVKGTSTSTAAPSVAKCTGAVIAVTAPNRGGAVVATGAYQQPAEALAAFVARDQTLVQTGYTQLTLADGSVVYANEVRPGVVVTSVHVADTGGGWSVVDWGASGC